MPIYVAMLRGINVGGHKRIKMEKLRSSFEAMGFESVKTYIQSGNVVFKSRKTAPSVLSKRIEEKILSDFGFAASVITRSADDIDATVTGNPFLREHGIDPEKLHVTFLSASPSEKALQQLAAVTVRPDQCHCSRKEIYFYFPNGVSQSVLFKSPVDRILAVVTTTRNWKTVNSLRQMCQDCL